MKIVVINPILYTSETSNIKKVDSIKDTMAYNFCLEIKKQGHEPILIAASDYKPLKDTNFDFKVIFLKTHFHKIFKPNCFPLMLGIGKVLMKECDNNFDCIISSEVFSMSSLYVSCKYKKKTIIWHELAKHNNILRKIPSLIWYNIISRIFFKNTRIVARSKNALDFIRKYCNNVSVVYIDHGVNLDEFIPNKNKDNYFVVISQLIPRKHIDGIIEIFANYLKLCPKFKLFIIGEGIEEGNLKNLVKDMKLTDNIIFLGKKTHEDMIPILSKAKALLINTEKDNSMLSIVESIATLTPIVTTNIPYNVAYIKKEKLGVVTEKLEVANLSEINELNSEYVNNCEKYRERVSNEYHVQQFIKEIKMLN